jgi:hypothetical protein
MCVSCRARKGQILIHNINCNIKEATAPLWRTAVSGARAAGPAPHRVSVADTSSSSDSFFHRRSLWAR